MQTLFVLCLLLKRSMDTESTIVPFVFVDGRRYVLAETDELPEPEILGKLTPPPRNVSSSMQWRLILCREGELNIVATFLGAFFCFGTLFLLGGDLGDFASWMLAIGVPILPYVLICVNRICSGMRESSSIIQFLQDGLVGKGRFYGMAPTGKKHHTSGKLSDNARIPEIHMKYQFAMQDGNTHNAFLTVTDMRQFIRLSDDSLKLFFYDPAQPNRNLLFDTLPKGIDFDEETGTFCTRPAVLLTQIVWLCVAFSAIPAITFAVAAFLC